MDFKRQIPDELTPLMPAEQNLLSSWTANEEVDWRTGDTVIDDPKNFADWGPNRVIRGRFFEWLCTDAIELPKPLGRINLSGIYIFGRPNLSFREIPIPLILQQCAIPAGINLAYANCRVLEISGSYLGSISANNMSASLLSIGPQSTLTGTFDLRSAKIGGDLNLAGSLFRNPRGSAIVANNIYVGGSVILANGFRANGTIAFISARISGNLSCEACRLWNPSGIAFHGDGMIVEGRGFLRNGFFSLGEVSLVAARFGRLLDCESAYFRNKKGAAIRADGIIIGGVASFYRSQFKGTLRLPRASIQGNLNLGSGVFQAPEETAVLCDNAQIQGLVYCGCEVIGAVSFIAAQIGGDLNCEKGVFRNQAGSCLNAAGATIKGRLFLRSGFQAIGGVNLTAASVANIVDCSKGTFTAGAPSADRSFAVAATFDRLSCGSLIFCDARVNGQLSVWGATIRGGLDLRGAHIVASSKDPRRIAVMANAAQLDGSLHCNKDTRMMGALFIVSAHIKGDLWCEELEFGSHRSEALNADGVRVVGRTLLSRSHFRGPVKFIGAGLDNSLACIGTEFDNPSEHCLNMTDANVKGGIFLRSATVRGNAVLVRVQVTGDIDCESATFSNPGGVSLDLRGAKVGGSLVWRSLVAEHGEVDFRNLRVSSVNDDSKSWLDLDVVNLHGMIYDSIDVDHQARVSARDRVKWLEKQRAFSIQPYEMLMHVLRNMGHDRDARIIGVAKLRGLRNSGELKGLAWFFNWLLDKLVGFGYEPAKPIFSLIALIALGTFVFSRARDEAVLCPTNFVTKTTEKPIIGSCEKPVGYPPFVPVLYSIEVIVPAIDFHQKKYWEMRSDAPWSEFFHFYSGVHVALGWLFSLLAALSPTKLLRRE